MRANSPQNSLKKTPWKKPIQATSPSLQIAWTQINIWFLYQRSQLSMQLTRRVTKNSNPIASTSASLCSIKLPDQLLRLCIHPYSCRCSGSLFNQKPPRNSDLLIFENHVKKEIYRWLLPDVLIIRGLQDPMRANISLKNPSSYWGVGAGGRAGSFRPKESEYFKKKDPSPGN